jgi:Fic family protein
VDVNNRSGVWVKQQSDYSAFIPKPLPPDPPLMKDDKMIRLLSDADRKLGRLDGLTQVLPNPDLFVAMYVQKEALISSQIEGTQASLVDILQTDAALGDRKLDIEEVVNYVKAINYGTLRLKTLPLSLRLIREIHAVLMEGVRGADKNPGEFRRSQNWIGPAGCTLSNASFVPPPPLEMSQALSDLEKYLHEDSSMPKLIQIALLHAQFETIHPFLDGNGRMGRLLITFWLFQQKILNYPLLYISLYFKKHKMEYYDHLNDVRMYGRWEEWVQFFLKAVSETADSATKCGREIIMLRDRLTKEVQERLRGKAYGIELLDYLFAHPIIRINDVKDLLEISYPTAKDLIDGFINMGILSPKSETKLRNKSYSFRQYINLLEEGTELL